MPHRTRPLRGGLRRDRGAISRPRAFHVTYVRNFTDVDDKIIRPGRGTRTPTRKQLAEKFIQEFYEDMDALNVARADYRTEGHRVHRADCRRSSPGSSTRATPIRSKATCFLPWRPSKATANFPGANSTTWRPGRGSKSMRANTTPLILPCGNRPSRANRPGTARGVRAGRGGTSNARP